MKNLRWVISLMKNLMKRKRKKKKLNQNQVKMNQKMVIPKKMMAPKRVKKIPSVPMNTPTSTLVG